MVQMGGVRLPLYGANPEVSFRNDSGVAVPSRAVIKITGSTKLANDQIVLTVDKPDDDGLSSEHYVNGPMIVNAGGYGRCIVPVSPTWVSYDTDAVPVFGEEWGPQDDSFKIATDGSGFRIVGNVNSTDGLVLARNDNASSALKEGLLDGNLAAPEDGLTAPTTAVMSVHELNVSGNLVDTGDNVTITNRDETLELSTGDFVIVSKVDGEYRPVFPSGESSLLKEGLLDGNLAAPEDGLTAPTTAVMSVYELNVAGNLVDSGDNVTVTNRDETLALSTGDHLIVSKFDDEYRPVSSTSSALKEGLVDGDLEAPEDGLTSPTTAVMSVHELNVSGNLVDSGDNVTITNRDEALTLSTGDFVIVTKFGDEYRPIYPSPPPCDEQNEIQIITVFGTPTGGDFELDVTIDGNTEAIEFDYDFTAGEVQDRLETHADISSTDVLCSGGPLPDAAVKVEFRNNLENTDIPIMMPDHGDLTGGDGMAVLVSVDQHGRE